MFDIKVTGVVYQFDKNAFDQALRNSIEKEVKLAAKDFAAAALARIPVRTGFVAGSIGTLTDLLGSQARLNPIVGFTRKILAAAGRFFSNRPPPASAPSEYYYPSRGSSGILKTPTSGRQFATPSGEVFKWQGTSFVFNYEVDISYFRINDSVAGFAPTAPWGAFLAGQEAFETHMLSVNLEADLAFEKFLTPIAVDNAR